MSTRPTTPRRILHAYVEPGDHNQFPNGARIVTILDTYQADWAWWAERASVEQYAARSGQLIVWPDGPGQAEIFDATIEEPDDDTDDSAVASPEQVPDRADPTGGFIKPPWPSGLDTERFRWLETIDRCARAAWPDGNRAIAEVGAAIVSALAAIHAAIAPDPTPTAPGPRPPDILTVWRLPGVARDMVVVSRHPNRSDLPNGPVTVLRDQPPASNDTFVGLADRDTVIGKTNPLQATADIYVETSHFYRTWFQT